MKAFLRRGSARIGLGLLSLLVVLGLAGPLLVPFPEAADHWHDLTYWESSPSAAPPRWMTPGTRSPDSSWAPAVVETLAGGARKVTRTHLVPAGGAATLVVRATEPFFLQWSFREAGGPWHPMGTRRVEAAPGQSVRIPLSLPAAGEFRMVELRLAPGADSPEPTLETGSRGSGWLGTDVAKRDVATGIVLGIRWALLLGVMVGLLTVALGVALALAAACLGGWVDSLLNRVYEFFSLIPLLPLLIAFSAVYRPSLWTLGVFGLLFFWTRAFKPVYAMALRIRQEAYVEAGRTLGAGRWRLALRYILPALLPYAFSAMALAVPSIILYEAGVSVLGLGDTSTVTWGQMLHDALSQGAVMGGLWWWILPPGFMIALTGLTFALLGRAATPSPPGR